MAQGKTRMIILLTWSAIFISLQAVTAVEVIEPCTDTTSGEVTDNNVISTRPSVSVIHQGAISKRTYDVIHFIISKCLNPVVVVTGVIGNSLSLAVFSHPSLEMKQTGVTYLKALCANDVVFLSVSMYQGFLPYFIDLNPSLVSKIKAYGDPYLNNCLIRWLGASSGLLVVVITMERFVALCFPLKISSSIFTRKPAIPISIAVLVYGVVCIPNIFRYRMMSYYDPDYKAVIYRTELKDISGALMQLFNILNVLGVTLYRVVTSIIVIVCNVTIVIQLYISRLRRSELTQNASGAGSSVAEKQASRMLVGVALFYLVCITPIALTHDFCSRFMPGFHVLGAQHYLFFIMIDLVIISGKTNSAANFFIYVMASGSFRRTLFKVICCERRSKVPASELQLSTINTVS